MTNTEDAVTEDSGTEETVAVAPPDAAVAAQSGAVARLRALRDEAAARGAPMVSSPAMQARLFEVYDEAATAPEALELVQGNLRLTLERNWYSASEIDQLADQLDWFLAMAPPEEAAAGDEGDQVHDTLTGAVAGTEAVTGTEAVADQATDVTGDEGPSAI